jgi:hypothetical protein
MTGKATSRKAVQTGRKLTNFMRFNVSQMETTSFNARWR